MFFKITNKIQAYINAKSSICQKVYKTLKIGLEGIRPSPVRMSHVLNVQHNMTLFTYRIDTSDKNAALRALFCEFSLCDMSYKSVLVPR